MFWNSRVVRRLKLAKAARRSAFSGCCLVLLSSCVSVTTKDAFDEPAKLERLLFEVCPKVVSGEVDLRDPVQVAALGLTPLTNTPKQVEVRIGKGTSRLTLWYMVISGKHVCRVRFGGPNNALLFRSVVNAGVARGWRAGDGAAELGGFVSFLYPPPPSTDLVMFTHWDEFDGLKPATNVGLVREPHP